MQEKYKRCSDCLRHWAFFSLSILHFNMQTIYINQYLSIQIALNY